MVTTLRYGRSQSFVFEGKPADYVARSGGGVRLFGNRVLKEYKEVNCQSSQLPAPTN